MQMSSYIRFFVYLFCASQITTGIAAMQKPPVSPPAIAERAPATPHLPAPRGIENLGNTCYANAVLQCLSVLPRFNSYCNTHQARVTNGILQAYTNLRNHITSGDIGFVSRSTHLETLTHLVGEGGQQDAEEFLTSLLGRIRVNDAAGLEDAYNALGFGITIIGQETELKMQVPLVEDDGLYSKMHGKNLTWWLDKTFKKGTPDLQCLDENLPETNKIRKGDNQTIASTSIKPRRLSNSRCRQTSSQYAI